MIEGCRQDSREDWGGDCGSFKKLEELHSSYFKKHFDKRTKVNLITEP